jgi:hypothetical protein
MYDLLAAVWNASSTATEQGTGRKHSLSESVLEDGCGDIVKDGQRGKTRYTKYRKCVRELRKSEQRKCLCYVC